MTAAPRHFQLHRDADVSGVSGLGHVADGVIFSDGHAAVHWLGRWPTTTPHPDGIVSVKGVHGHGGATRIVLLDSPEARLGRIAEAHSEHLGDGGFTFGDCNECGHVWPCPTYAWATTDRDPLATWDPADDEPQLEPCSACLLPKGDAPVERCIVEGPHDTHVTAMGRRWTDAHLTDEQP
jgi:hypothetical protein